MVKRHDLSLADVTQRCPDRTEEVLRPDTVSIPVGDGICEIRETVRFAIGKGEILCVLLGMEFSLRLDTIDTLVVQNTAIILKELSVLACHIDQHGRESVTATATRPNSRCRPPGIMVTGATTIAPIDWSETLGYGSNIVVKVVATIEAREVASRHPRSLGIIGKGGIHKYGGSASGQSITIRHLHVLFCHSVLITACREE